MGRLFDAASAVLGVHGGAQYEGEAAMKLEALARARTGETFDLPVAEAPDGTWTLDPLPLLVALGERRRQGRDRAELAAAFHDSVVSATTRLLCRARERTGVTTVALGGGVFQNVRLADTLTTALEVHGFRVLAARRLSPNDGAVSYGQAAVAAARLTRAETSIERGSRCA
jgi:hydrogenase maturation protein HypF